jgi:hypothetical protein
VKHERAALVASIRLQPRAGADAREAGSYHASVPSDASKLGPYRTPTTRHDDDVEEASADLPRICPDCAGTLAGILFEHSPLGFVSVFRCDGCRGHFVTHDAMQAVATRAIRQVKARTAGYGEPAGDAERTKLCPLCNLSMTHAFFGHGCPVLVDVCADHGTWFDAHELEIALDALAAGVRWTRPGRNEAPPPSSGPAATAPSLALPFIPPASQWVALADIAATARALADAAHEGDLAKIRELDETLRAHVEKLLRLAGSPI